MSYQAKDVVDAFYQGAATAFGLMGMAFAIQQRERERPRRELDAKYEKLFGSRT